MPSKKKKYNARFPAGRIKKIMQTDEEIGKVAQAVPVIISRTLELFVEELITKTMQITTMKNARTLSPHHMKQCILSESRFDFLKDLVKSVPEVATSDDDLGPFSDCSSTVATRQRSNSKDATVRSTDNGTTSSASSAPSNENQFDAFLNSQPESIEVDDSSSSDEDVEMPENLPNDVSKETLHQECVKPFPFTSKNDTESEDYDDTLPQESAKPFSFPVKIDSDPEDYDT